jgi:WLM domain
MEPMEIIVFILAAIILFIFVKGTLTEVAFVVSKIDGNRYLVQNFEDKHLAADLLADISKDLSTLVKHMHAKYPDNEDVQRLRRNFNASAISEGTMENGYTSYSVNKGEKIVMCVRQKDNSLVPKNVVMYVGIHELSHIMTSDIGHTPEFWDNFKFLLQEAILCNVYVKQDFASTPEPYCGIQITSSII